MIHSLSKDSCLLKVEPNLWQFAERFFRQYPNAVKLARQLGKDRLSDNYLLAHQCNKIDYSFIQVNHEIYALAPKASYFGEGQFGLVKLCQNKANQSYAVKIVAGSLQSQATAELEILNYLKQLKGVADRTLPGFKRFKSKTVAHKSYIVQAKKPGKDMWSALYGNLPTIPYLNTTEKYMIAILACQEIQHLHEKNIIHSDIKPENFMLNKEGKMITIAAIDFGYAKQLTPTDQHYRVDNKNMPYYALKQIQGTTKYIAPEIANLEFYPDFSLKRFIDCQGHYYFASDIYSLGIMFIEDL